jgi:hypothetical protein
MILKTTKSMIENNVLWTIEGNILSFLQLFNEHTK